MKIFEYNIGDFVYLKTDPDQRKGIITEILIRESGVMFNISFGSASSWHYSFEITKERDILTATS